MPFYGAALVCVDDEAIRSLLPSIARPITTYGFADDAQVQAVNVRAVGTQMHFTARRRNGITLPDLDVVLNLPGRHNVLNALAAIAVAVELGVPDEAVQRGLAEFNGVGRRFQRYGEVAVKSAHGEGSFTVVDDYGPPPG